MQDIKQLFKFTVLRKAFDSFDREKSGSIPTDLVADILRLMGQPFNKKILDELIDEVDADSAYRKNLFVYTNYWSNSKFHGRFKLTILYFAESGRLEFEEFVTLAAKFIVEEDAEALEKELREAFRLYDKEGKRSIVLYQRLKIPFWYVFVHWLWDKRKKNDKKLFIE